MTLPETIPLFLTAAGLAYLLIRVLFMPLSQRSGLLLDAPNDRSLHQAPVARVGGAGLLAAAACSLLIWTPWIGAQDPWQTWLGGAVAALFLLSLADDAVRLPSLARLACHLVIVWAFVSGTGWNRVVADIHSGVATALVVLGITWWTNLNNFMDGADGLAGGMAAIGFATLAFAAGMDSATGVRMAQGSIALAGAATGFLVLNFSPAKVFMGDAGAIPLGFLAAAFAWIGFTAGLWPWWFGPMVFSPFIADATVTLMRRMLAGKPVWKAHREHFYQRLILSGWSHTKTCLLYYFLMLWSTFCALLAKKSPRPWMWVIPLVVTYASLFALLEWRFRQEKKHGKNSGTG